MEELKLEINFASLQVKVNQPTNQQNPQTKTKPTLQSYKASNVKAEIPD